MYGLLESDARAERNSLIISPTTLQSTMIFNDNNLNTCEEMIYGTVNELVPAVMENSLLDVNFMKQESHMDNLHYFNSISAYKTNVPKSILEDSDVPTIMNDFHFQENVVVEEVAEEEIISEPSDCGTTTGKNATSKRSKIQLGKKNYYSTSQRRSKKSQSLSRSFLFATRNKYECCKCGVTFCRKKLLINHMQSHVSSVSSTKSFVESNLVPPFSDDLSAVDANEFSYVHEKKSFVNYSKSGIEEAEICEICGYFSDDSADMVLHLKQHNKMLYKCSYCEKIFPSFEAINQHAENTHNIVSAFSKNTPKSRRQTKLFSNSPLLECTLCSKQFYTKAKLKRHMLTHRDKAVVCEECGEKMADFRALANHRSMHHVSAARNGVLTTRTFPCYACSKVFGSRSSQQIHMRIHTGERPYNCKYCVKAFADGGTLRKHERIHTGEKPYVCPICRKAFNQRVVLREHIRAHHAGSNSISARQYKCEVCPAVCDTPQELCSHLVKHSDDNTARHRNIVNRPRKYKKWKTSDRDVTCLEKPSSSTDEATEVKVEPIYFPNEETFVDTDRDNEFISSFLQQNDKCSISEITDVTIYIRDNGLEFGDHIEESINKSKSLENNFSDLTIAFEKLPEESVSSESCEAGSSNDNDSCLSGEILNKSNSNSYFGGNDYEDCSVEGELTFPLKEKYEFPFDSDYCVDSGLGLGAIVELT